VTDLNREERVGDEIVELQGIAQRDGKDVPALHPPGAWDPLGPVGAACHGEDLDLFGGGSSLRR
jgi:hypothetical protein